MSDSTEQVKERELKQIIASMQVDASKRPSVLHVAEKHNEIVEHSATWIYNLRNRYHEIDGLLHSVNGLAKAVAEGHNDLKAEQAEVRKATDANTAQLSKLVTIGDTTLFWFKVFLGASGTSILIGMAFAVFKFLMGS